MIVIIMAGGIGKRMESDLPKVLHMVTHPDNKDIKLPMLIHVIITSIKLNPSKIFVIVGKFKTLISETIDLYVKQGFISNPELIEFVDQETPLGTAHAIKCVLEHLNPMYLDQNALILSGDVPLISIQTLYEMMNENNQNPKLLITELDEPFGCGRILLNDKGNIVGIREEKDCGDDEKKIQLVNCGIYKIGVSELNEFIPLISNNNKSQEYYLTDIIDLMVKSNILIQTQILNKFSQWEIKNVNTKKDLEELNNFVLNELNCSS